jgi:hypothetical protein
MYATRSTYDLSHAVKQSSGRTDKKKSLVKLHRHQVSPTIPSTWRLGKKHWNFGKSEPSSLLLQETVLNKSFTWLMLYGYLNYFVRQKIRSPSCTRARNQNLQILASSIIRYLYEKQAQYPEFRDPVPACSWVHLKWASARDKIEHQWFDGTWQQNSEVHIRFLCYFF